MKRARYPTQATEAALSERFTLELLAHGPTRSGWEGDYLLCPECRTFVLKGGGNHSCQCGNLFVDSDALRIIVERGPGIFNRHVQGDTKVILVSRLTHRWNGRVKDEAPSPNIGARAAQLNRSAA